MAHARCVGCSELRRCQENKWSWIYLSIGLVATISMRLVTVLAHVDALYGQIAWYIAICGFLVFFLYKFRIDSARSRLIVQNKLLEKMDGAQTIGQEDRHIVGAILCALSTNKDWINYFVIFSSSVIALVLALYFDFIVSR